MFVLILKINQPDVQTSSGVVPKLGVVKFKIVELLCLLLSAEVTPLAIKHIIESRGPLVILKMMSTYHRHSIFQFTCLYFIRLCLRIEILRESILEDFGLLDFIIAKATTEWYCIFMF